jgi:hypothetical protein
MAITIKPNQALGFNVNDSCNCGGEYCQPILTDDLTMLQGTVDAASDIDLIVGGDFSSGSNWSLDAGWTISGNKLHATNIGGGSTADSVLPLGLVAGRIYALSCSITVTSQGSAGNNQGYIVKVNNQTMPMPNGWTAYNQTMVATWFFIADAITADIIQFSTNESTIDFDVNYIELKEVSQIGLGIYNSSGILEDSYATFTGNNSLKYYFNGEQITVNGVLFVGEVTENSLPIFELLIDDWASLTDYIGCGYVKIYDTIPLTERVRNGTFTGNADYWTLGGGWSYSANSASYTTGLTNLTQQLSLMGGMTYDLSFLITFLGFGNSGVLLINNTPIQTFTGNGTQTYTLHLTAYTGLVDIELGFTGYLLADHAYTIDAISLIASEIDSLNVSSCINLQTTHPCTLLLYAANLDNAFGFDYVSGALRHYLRIEAKKDVSGFPEEKEEYRFSDNSRELLYAMSETEYEINVTDAPDYIHACIRMMRLNDVFQIDATEYVADSNYDFKKRRSSKLKQSMFTVKDKDGISSNYSCS